MSAGGHFKVFRLNSPISVTATAVDPLLREAPGCDSPMQRCIADTGVAKRFRGGIAIAPPLSFLLGKTDPLRSRGDWTKQRSGQ